MPSCPPQQGQTHNDYFSDRGGQRAAALYALIGTAKLNDIDPQAWLADVLARMPNMPVSRLPDLLPWNWDPGQKARREAA
jgi:transposase